ncbi:hypothetical protein KAX02_03650 [candidate division WOR-3 bacterium]|nr:hypothetical protein [candidate division WOR-3 bacterium]
MSEEIKGGKTEVELEVRDRDGKVVQRYKQEAKSWLKNYYYWLAMMMGLAEQQGLTEIGGGYHPYNAACANTWDDAPAGAETDICIGTSDKVFDVNDYELDALAGRVAVGMPIINVGAKTVQITSVFGVSVETTVKETGINFALIQDTGGTTHTVVIERSVLGTPVVIPAGGSVTVKYTISHA